MKLGKTCTVVVWNTTDEVAIAAMQVRACSEGEACGKINAAIRAEYSGRLSGLEYAVLPPNKLEWLS